jgi:hypothetical protein
MLEEEFLSHNNYIDNKTFEINLYIKRFNPITKKLSVNLDFTFNSLRNVKRVEWKEEVPWY